MIIGAGHNAMSYYLFPIIFVDAMKMAQDHWTIVQAAGQNWPPPVGGTMPALDANGYPIGLAALPSHGYGLATSIYVSNAYVHPPGVYTLQFDGEGTVMIRIGNGSVQPNQTFNQADGHSQVYSVDIPATTSAGFSIVIVASNPANYVRNIRLVMPGYQGTYLTQPFESNFLAQLKPLQIMRFSGLPINSSTQMVGFKWANMTPVTYRTQCTTNGVAVEYVVALANALGQHIWASYPVDADHDFLYNYTKYVLDNLAGNLSLYVEYGNETWNTFYSNEFQFIESYRILLGFPKNWQGWTHALAILAKQTWDVCRSVLPAGHQTRIKRVAASQLVNPAMLADELSALVLLSAAPDMGFDVISVASYFGPTQAQRSGYTSATTTDQVLVDSSANLAQLDSDLAAFMVVAKKYPFAKTIMYESGLNMTSDFVNPSPWYAAMIGVQTSPDTYPVMLDHFHRLQKAGVDGMVYSSFIYPASMWGQTGLIQYSGEPIGSAPKLKALTDFIAGA